jgi:hypothetical protein
MTAIGFAFRATGARENTRRSAAHAHATRPSSRGLISGVRSYKLTSSSVPYIYIHIREPETERERVCVCVHIHIYIYMYIYEYIIIYVNINKYIYI